MSEAAAKYNTVMPETDDRTVCMEVDKPISLEGYKDNFLPHVENIMEKHGELRILVYFKEYKGWEEEAAKFDIEQTLHYGKHITKLAYVNPPEKIIFANKVRKPLIKGEIKFFEEKELSKAIDWVKA